MVKRLITDQQFEKAYNSHSTVYVRDKLRQTDSFIGSLDAFNPVFVTVSGKTLIRSEFEFLTVDS